MEYNKEECSSSESGWTMYIASSPDDEFSYDEYNLEDSLNKHQYKDVNVENAKNHESDDSMNSDASSGPSHQEFSNDIKNAEQKANKKSGKNQQKQAQKKSTKQNRKTSKEDPGSKVNPATNFSDNRSMYRKNK
ncbi:hypothetical protein Leryth_024218 [Lithospermum erythrorhizon]|uniref:Uncharacterized protein n=1 Tax=Lithospermum erythrorhizon TaxID=34254 RepID=A0AAV3PE79_LITER|nr:hypothetical protein Leryth_024218 [Lithospermum erythrorhizon]